jgi:carbon monoxide dehydrogenase subunit G
MPRVSVTTRIAEPVEEVFALAADLGNAPGRIKGIKQVEFLTAGPVGVGTRFRETRVMFGKEASEVMEFVTFEPNRGYALAAESCGARYLTTFRFEPDGAGTMVTVDFEAKPVSFFARLLSPLSRLMSGMVRKCLQQDLDDLKSAAESAGRPA